MSKQKIETIKEDLEPTEATPAKAKTPRKRTREQRYTVRYETRTGPAAQSLTVTEMQHLLAQQLKMNTDRVEQFNKTYHEAQTAKTQLADAQRELAQLKTQTAVQEGTIAAYQDALRIVTAALAKAPSEPSPFFRMTPGVKL